MKDILVDEFNIGFGKFSRWDAFRARTKIDTCCIVWRKGKAVYLNVSI